MAAYPTVNYRYLFEEHDKAGGKAEMNFDGKATWPMQIMGRQDAYKALQEGPGVGFLKHIDSRRDKPSFLF